jgi:hypothetical protein
VDTFEDESTVFFDVCLCVYNHVYAAPLFFVSTRRAIYEVNEEADRS